MEWESWTGVNGEDWIIWWSSFVCLGVCTDDWVSKSLIFTKLEGIEISFLLSLMFLVVHRPFVARESFHSVSHNIHIFSQILGPKNFEVYIMFCPCCHVYIGDFYPSLVEMTSKSRWLIPIEICVNFCVRFHFVVAMVRSSRKWKRVQECLVIVTIGSAHHLQPFTSSMTWYARSRAFNFWA